MAVETKRLISVTDPDLLYPWPGPGLRPGGPGFLPPGYFLPPGTSPGLFPRTPGQGTTPQGLIDALAARGIQGVTNETAWFLLMVYGGPDTQAQGISADEIILAMTQDGSLTTEGGISTVPRLDLKAIDPKLIAQAIFHEAGVDPSVPGTALDANLLRFGTQILTGNPNAHSDELAVTLIRMFGSGGIITVEQLAEAIGGGAMEFSQDAGAPFLSVTHNYDRAGIVAGRETQYLLSFDTNGDGGVDWQELQTGLQSNLYENQVIDPKMAQMLWHFYGTNVNGTWVITAEGLDAMKADGVLRDWANSDGSAGFAISLASINPDRFVAGLMRYDRDNSGDLQPGELSEILTFYAGADGRVDPEITRRLGILYGGRNGIEADGLKQMLAEGVLVPATGPGGAETAGFRINLDAVPTERVVDRMFLYLGKDPATATMTTEEFERAIDFVTGDENPINGDVAAYIGAMRGVPDGAGGHTLNRAQVLSVFTSGAITRKSEPGLSIIPIQNNVNHEVPKHHHHHWWDSVLKFFGEGAKDVIAALSRITKVGEEVIADIFNGKMTLEQAIAAGAHDLMANLIKAVQEGSEEALALMDQLGAAIKHGIEGLSAEAHAFVDNLIADVKTAGDKMAIQLLATLSGMKPEEAKTALEEAASKAKLFSSLSTMTFDEMKAMIPNFDQLYAEGKKAQDEYFANMLGTEEGRATLQAEGFTVTANRRVLSQATGAEMSAEEKQDFYDKHIRIDVAPLELNGGWQRGTALDGVQGRLFFTMPRRDKDGNLYMEFRLRELDEAGVADGDSNLGGDAGLVAVRDLVVPFYVSGPRKGEGGHVRYQSTLAVIGEGNFSANGFLAGLAKVFPSIAPHVVDAEATTPLPAYWKNKADVEIGGGVGVTVAYDLKEIGTNNWILGAEIAGAVGGAVGGAVLMGLATYAGFGAFVEKFGATSIHAMADMGAFGMDLLLWQHYGDNASLEAGAFGWMAFRAGSPTLSGSGGAWAQLRGRLQVNISSDPFVTA